MSRAIVLPQQLQTLLPVATGHFLSRLSHASRMELLCFLHVRGVAFKSCKGAGCSKLPFKYFSIHKTNSVTFYKKKCSLQNIILLNVDFLVVSSHSTHVSEILSVVCLKQLIFKTLNRNFLGNMGASTNTLFPSISLHILL